nr:MAG TPA: Putative Holin-like Toxin (Hol-Tox) [Caudoviricetes sp.]
MLPLVSSLAKGVVLMSTYEELMIILTTASLIVSILKYTHKK